MFSAYPFPCGYWENIYTVSYNHHQIGSMNYYPLFRVNSWNNGVRCMSFCILTKCTADNPKFQLVVNDKVLKYAFAKSISARRRMTNIRQLSFRAIFLIFGATISLRLIFFENPSYLMWIRTVLQFEKHYLAHHKTKGWWPLICMGHLMSYVAWLAFNGCDSMQFGDK